MLAIYNSSRGLEKTRDKNNKPIRPVRVFVFPFWLMVFPIKIDINTKEIKPNPFLFREGVMRS